MSNYNQPQAYPPPVIAYPAEPQGGYAAAPAAVAYPVKDGHQDEDPQANSVQSRGDGFWRGCCAALCCCCLLDACF